MALVNHREVTEFVKGHGFPVDLVADLETHESVQAHGSIARVLLDTPSTAVYHLNPNETTTHDICREFIKPVLLGANYEQGDSDARLPN